MSAPKTHLGHYIGPAPTNEELGIGTTHDSPPPHEWEPDFSEGEPAHDSKICGFCGREHEDKKSSD